MSQQHWAAYNNSLVQRGSLTLWISEGVLENWHPEPAGPRQRGGQVQYSHQAIECMLTLRAVFKLPYRQTEGLGQSIMDTLDVSATFSGADSLAQPGGQFLDVREAARLVSAEGFLGQRLPGDGVSS